MNVENMLKVADAIEKENAGGEKFRFDMRTWLDYDYYCGTAACVAGTALLIARDENYRICPTDTVVCPIDTVDTIGSNFLDLNGLDKDELFLASFSRIPLDEINQKKELVPDALRWMALNEKVDWNKGLEAAECIRNAKKSECSSPHPRAGEGTPVTGGEVG